MAAIRTATFIPFDVGCYPVPLAVLTGSSVAFAFEASLKLLGITPLTLVVRENTYIVHPDHLALAEESVTQAYVARDTQISATPANAVQVAANTERDIAAMRVATVLIPVPAAVGGVAAVPATAQVQMPLWALVGKVSRETVVAYETLGVRTSTVRLGGETCLVPTDQAVVASQAYRPGTPAPVVSVPSGGITLQDAYAGTLPAIVRALARTFGRGAISFVEVMDPATRVTWFITATPTTDLGAVIRRLELAHH